MATRADRTTDIDNASEDRTTDTQDVTCFICLEALATAESFAPQCAQQGDIPHHLCKPCAYRFAQHSIQNHTAAICPAAGCRNEWTAADFRAAGMRRQRIAPPTAWKQGDAIVDPQLAPLLARLEVQQCPYCRVPTIRNGGCPNMTCARCHQHWRWQSPSFLQSLYRRMTMTMFCTIALQIGFVLSVLYGLWAAITTVVAGITGIMSSISGIMSSIAIGILSIVYRNCIGLVLIQVLFALLFWTVNTAVANKHLRSGSKRSKARRINQFHAQEQEWQGHRKRTQSTAKYDSKSSRGGGKCGRGHMGTRSQSGRRNRK